MRQIDIKDYSHFAALSLNFLYIKQNWGIEDDQLLKARIKLGQKQSLKTRFHTYCCWLIGMARLLWNLINILTCKLISKCQKQDSCDLVLQQSKMFKGYETNLRKFSSYNKASQDDSFFESNRKSSKEPTHHRIDDIDLKKRKSMSMSEASKPFLSLNC